MSKRQAERDVKSGANAPVIPNPDKSRAEGQDIEQKVEQKKKRKSIPKEKKEKSDGRTAAFGVGEDVRKEEEVSWWR